MDCSGAHDGGGLKRRALEEGFDAAGICDAQPPPHYGAYVRWLQQGFHATMAYLDRHRALKNHPQNLLPGVRSILAVALNYNQPAEQRPGHPRVARYALGRDYHKIIRPKLRRVAEWAVRELGGNYRVCVDSAPILERDYAQLAGLGWYGKNTCLIDSRRGSWFFIGLLLLTERFRPDAPAVGGCGSCRLCIDACPTGAIVPAEEGWRVDARKCVSYLTIEHRGPIDPGLQERIGDWTFGCDVCQEVCPFNQPRPQQPFRAPATEAADLLRRTELPPLDRLATLSEDEWDPLTRGSALRRAGFEGLRRNAEINLRNCRRPDFPR